MSAQLILRLLLPLAIGVTVRAALLVLVGGVDRPATPVAAAATGG